MIVYNIFNSIQFFISFNTGHYKFYCFYIIYIINRLYMYIILVFVQAFHDIVYYIMCALQK